MAAVSFKFTGLEELRAELRTLPTRLHAEAAGIVEASGASAAGAVKAEYAQHRVTGNLEKGVKVEHKRDGLAARSVVRSTAQHAFIFENGTVARHYITVEGKKHQTGRMPAFNIFIPIVIRARRAMYQQFAALMRRAGLTVTGEP